MRWQMALALLGLAACGKGEGTVEVKAWGEEPAVDGFAASETDGWTIGFDHWYTLLADVELADPQSGDVEASLPGPYLIDWTEHAAPVTLATLSAPAGRQDVAFSTPVAGTAADGVGSADAQALERLEAAGAVHLVEGYATDGERSVTFS